MNDYDGIFDHLTPDDFARTTSAVDERSRTSGGAAQFEEWTNEQLRTTRTAYIAAEGDLQPIAVIASPTSERTFTPDDDETLGQFIQRVATEAKQIGAIWTFIQKKTMVGTKLVDENNMPTINDTESVQKALDAGVLVTGIAWFAERNEGDQREQRIGTMVETEPNRLGQPSEAEHQSIPPVVQILD